MAQARGYMTQTMIDFETAFKVAPVSPAGQIVPFNTNSVGASQNLNDPNTITGTRNPVEPIHGNVSVDGELAIPLDFNAQGIIFKGIFGDPTTTSETVDDETVYTHTYKIGNVQPSLIIEKAFKDIGQYFKYAGCKVSSYKLPFGGDNEAVATVSIMGATETAGTTTYDASAATVALERAENFQARIYIGGSEVASRIKSGELTIDCGLDGDQYCVGDEGTRGDIPEGILSVSGNMTALFTDRSFIDMAIGGTESSLELIYTKGNYELSFLFPEILFERNGVPIEGNSGVVETVNWRAYHKDDADNSVVVVTLKNLISSY